MHTVARELTRKEVNEQLLQRTVLNAPTRALGFRLDAPGKQVAMSGDAALARGLLEGGAQIVTSFPGAPACHYPDLLAAVADEFGMYVEWSINEKVAFEVAAAGAMVGLRTCYGGKDLGMNVVSDSILQFSYGGVEGGMVMIAGTDIGGYVSSGEFDCRFYATMLRLVGLDPADPQEAKDMIVAGLDISERLKIPVLLLITNEVAWSHSPVTLGPFPQIRKAANVVTDASRWSVHGGPGIHARKRWQEDQLKLMKELANELPFNRLEMKGDEEFGIITTGVASNYVQEVREAFGLTDIAVLKLGCFNPLPEKLVEKLLSQVKRVLVVEAMDPYIENKIREFASLSRKAVEVRGKQTGDLPAEGIYTFELVAIAIQEFTGHKLRLPALDKAELRKQIVDLVPVTRNPCPGCPHRASYYALKQALRQTGKGGKEDSFIIPDSGCSSSSASAMNMASAKMNLGSSIAIMNGLRHSGVADREIVATIGDSAFLHGGVAPLMDMTQHGVDGMVVVMDNGGNAATGHQPTASMGVTAQGWDTKQINFALIAKACNVDFIKTVDPYSLKDTQAAMVEAISKKGGQRMVVSSRECAFTALTRRKLEKAEVALYYVNEEQCTGSKVCVSEFGCPAIYLKENGKASIEEQLCIGCGVCAEVCPSFAFRRRG